MVLTFIIQDMVDQRVQAGPDPYRVVMEVHQLLLGDTVALRLATVAQLDTGEALVPEVTIPVSTAMATTLEVIKEAQEETACILHHHTAVLHTEDMDQAVAVVIMAVMAVVVMGAPYTVVVIMIITAFHHILMVVEYTMVGMAAMVQEAAQAMDLHTVMAITRLDQVVATEVVAMEVVVEASEAVDHTQVVVDPMEEVATATEAEDHSVMEEDPHRMVEAAKEVMPQTQSPLQCTDLWSQSVNLTEPVFVLEAQQQTNYQGEVITQALHFRVITSHHTPIMKFQDLRRMELLVAVVILQLLLVHTLVLVQSVDLHMGLSHYLPLEQPIPVLDTEAVLMEVHMEEDRRISEPVAAHLEALHSNIRLGIIHNLGILTH